MAAVSLTDTEWQQVLSCMAFAPAREVIPLLNKIGAQLQRAQAEIPPEVSNRGVRLDGDREIRNE
jgi:hypothetical protein